MIDDNDDYDGNDDMVITNNPQFVFASTNNTTSDTNITIIIILITITTTFPWRDYFQFSTIIINK